MLLLMKGKFFMSYQENNLLLHLHSLYQIFKLFLCCGPLKVWKAYILPEKKYFFELRIYFLRAALGKEQN